MSCWVDTINLQNCLTRSDLIVTLRLAPQTVPGQPPADLERVGPSDVKAAVLVLRLTLMFLDIDGL